MGGLGFTGRTQRADGKILFSIDTRPEWMETGGWILHRRSTELDRQVQIGKLMDHCQLSLRQ